MKRDHVPLETQVRILVVAVVGLIVGAAALHVLSIWRLHVDGITELNVRTVTQISNYYETHLDGIHAYVLHASTDEDLNELVRAYRPLYHYKTGLVGKLEAVVGASRFAHSAYASLAGPGIVYSTSFIRPLPLAHFPDLPPLRGAPERGVLRMAPRTVQFPESPHSVLSYVARLPLVEERKHGTLVVNVDLAALTASVLRSSGVSGAHHLTVTGERGELIVESNVGRAAVDGPGIQSAADRHGLLATLSSELAVTSTWESPVLGWRFRLTRTVQQPPGPWRTASVVLRHLIVVLIVIMVVGGVTVLTYQRVFKGLIAGIDDLIWRSFLTSTPGSLALQRRALRAFRTAPAVRYDFVPLVIYLARGGADEPLAAIEACCARLGTTHEVGYRLVAADSRRVMLIVAIRREHASPEHLPIIEYWALQLIAAVAGDGRRMPFIIVGRPEPTLQQVPPGIAYASELFRYRLALRRNVVFVERDLPPNGELEYPDDEESDIVSAVVSHDIERLSNAVARFVDRLTFLSSGHTNEAIAFSARHLCAQVARRVLSANSAARIPLPNRRGDYWSVTSLETAITRCLRTIEARIPRDARLREPPQWKRDVVAYLHQSYNDENVNLNLVADRFGKSRSAVSKAVRELTGRGVTDLIRQLRIERAKELLTEAQPAVEAVARKVGYRYAYYFIRVFKSLEGITPGQYRALRMGR